MVDAICVSNCINYILSIVFLFSHMVWSFFNVETCFDVTEDLFGFQIGIHKYGQINF